MDSTELVIGRGEVYFDPFAPGTLEGTGERYIGNTPSVTMERSLSFEESRASIGGTRTKNAKVLSGEDTRLTFVTDNISIDNQAMWVGGEIDKASASGSDGHTESFTLKPGVFYQLGKQIIPVIGVRSVWAVNVFLDDNTNISDMLYIDEANGRFGVPIGATSLNDVTVTATYEVRAHKYTHIISKSTVQRGSLRFVSKNPVGPKHHYFFPNVVLYPRDSRELKGDNYSTITFEAESLAPMHDFTVTSTGNSPGMAALIAVGVSISSFPALEAIFHSALNGV